MKIDVGIEGSFKADPPLERMVACLYQSRTSKIGSASVMTWRLEIQDPVKADPQLERMVACLYQSRAGTIS